MMVGDDNPTIGFNADEILNQVRHMNSEHASDADAAAIAACSTCTAFTRRWTDLGGDAAAQPRIYRATSMYIAPVGSTPDDATWTDVGRISTDGSAITFAETEPAGVYPTITLYAAPAAGSSPPVGDVLDAVDDDGNMLCACGCRRKITDRSPSAYFASQNCSDQWHTNQLTPDQAAALTDGPFVDLDDYLDEPASPDNPFVARPLSEQTTEREQSGRTAPGPWPVTYQRHEHVPAISWLNQIHPRYAGIVFVYHAGPGPEDRITARLPQQLGVQGTDLAPFAYRRYCSYCDAWVSPYTCSEAPRAQLVTFDQVRQRCLTCEHIVPGRPMLGWVDRFRGGVRLQLEDGTARTIEDVRFDIRFVSSEEISPMWDGHDNADRIARTWQRMEDELDSFSRRYTPPSTPTPAPGDDRPYHLDVPPAPRTRPLLPWRAGGRT